MSVKRDQTKWKNKNIFFEQIVPISFDKKKTIF